MAQHFLLSAAARNLSLTTILRLSESEAAMLFRRLRWPETHGEPVCPECACTACYAYRSRPVFKCKGCQRQFSVTSGTLFAWRKLPIAVYLAAIVLFVNAVKGISALQLGRDLDISYKAAFVLAHKLREAMAAELAATAILGGVGSEAEIDGAYFGGHVRPANHAVNRIDRRLVENQSGKRKAVVVVREREGRTVPAVFTSEDQGVAFIKARLAKGTTVHADEAACWNDLHARYDMRRINHSEAYSAEGACTNFAESFFARLRRAEMGQHHHLAGVYLKRYAQEMAWKETHRGDPNGEQFTILGHLAAACRPSVDFCGYWQRPGQVAVG
jgi:transposase-like protein